MIKICRLAILCRYGRSQLTGKLIIRIQIPLNAKLAFEYVSRTPLDKPIVSAALAQWPSGRTRLVVGGYGKAPILAMDGTESNGLEAAARNAFEEAGDEMASSEYRRDVGAILAMGVWKIQSRSSIRGQPDSHLHND